MVLWLGVVALPADGKGAAVVTAATEVASAGVEETAVALWLRAGQLVTSAAQEVMVSTSVE